MFPTDYKTLHCPCLLLKNKNIYNRILTFKAEPRGNGESDNVKEERVDAAENVSPIVFEADEEQDLEHDQAHVHVLGNE